MATKRIIEETTGTAASGDYVLTDSSTAGTKKVELVGMVDDAIDSALDGYEPADGSIDADMLADNAVTTPKLADNAVTDAKLSATGVLAKANRLLGNVLRGTATGAVAQAHGTYAAPPLGLTVHGKSVQDGTPTPSSPVAIQSIGDVVANTCTKNLLPHPPATINTDGGVTFTDNGDGSYTINGTATKNTYIYVTRRDTAFALPAGTYTLSARSADGTMPSDLYVGASRWNGSTNTNYGTTKGGDFTFTHDGTGYVQILVYVNNGYTVNNATVWPQLELGSSRTSYVPWTASSTTIDLQGHELRSLPDGTHDELTVDADGNVTLVQRVGVKPFYVAGVRSSSFVVDGVTYYQYTDNGFTLRRAQLTNTSGSLSYMSDMFEATHSSVQNYANPNKLSFNTSQYSMYAYIQSTEGEGGIQAMRAWLAEHPVNVLYALATPVTYDLGTVTMPALAAPDATAWATTTPATTVTLDYERDLTMAITAIESAIADMA